MTTNDGKAQGEVGKSEPAGTPPRVKFNEAYPLEGEAYRWATQSGRYPMIAKALFGFYRERGRKLGHGLSLSEAHEATADFLKQQQAAKEAGGGGRWEESEELKARKQKELEERMKKNSDEHLDADAPPEMYRNGDPEAGVPCQYEGEGGCDDEGQPKTRVLLDGYGMPVLHREGPLAGTPVVVGEFTVRLGGVNRMPEIACICRCHQAVMRQEAVKAGKMPPRFVPYAAAAKLVAELRERRAASDKAREAREKGSGEEDAPQRKKKVSHYGGARDVSDLTHRRVE